jgi:glycosyltransferase involved in cell wall biosynthesis
MIVKNEAKVLERCFASVAPWIDRYAVCDTGSTDGTPELVRSFFDARGIPGVVPTFPFVNFAQARNQALAIGRSRCEPGDYLMLVDADMELVVRDADFRAKLSEPVYMVAQHAGIRYDNVRLVRADEPAAYDDFPTHEYLNTRAGQDKRLEGVHFVDHADGSSRPEKFERDVRLLYGYLEEHPSSARAMFYLAQTYKDMGRLPEAILWYRRRVQAGGWVEEAWYAQFMIAQCLMSAGDESFVGEALRAYDMRPSRAEPLHMLAKHYREKGQSRLANLFVLEGLKIPRSTDALFVEVFAYDYGLRQELSISGFYSADERVIAASRRACFDLSVDADAPDEVRRLAAANSVHHARLALEVMPSFRKNQILLGEETPEKDASGANVYVEANPSVFLGVSGETLCNVRLVNYAVTAGRYTMREAGKLPFDAGVVRTRNAIVDLVARGPGRWERTRTRPVVDDLEGEAVVGARIQGYEDLRPFAWRGRLWGVATVLDRGPSGLPEIALLKLREEEDSVRVRAVHVQRGMGTDRPQKNWMPLVRGDELLLVYGCDPTVILRVDPETLQASELERSVPSLELSSLRGSSQAIPIDEGFLCVIHEAFDSDAGRRYVHRFVRLDRDLAIDTVSDPFRFEHTGIEFCAGLARVGDRLLVSYGVEDREACVASVDLDEVVRFLES